MPANVETHASKSIDAAIMAMPGATTCPRPKRSEALPSGPLDTIRNTAYTEKKMPGLPRPRTSAYTGRKVITEAYVSAIQISTADGNSADRNSTARVPAGAAARLERLSLIHI